MAEARHQGTAAGRAVSLRRWVLTLILTLVVAAFVRLYMSLEWIEEEVPIGFSEAAKRNPFLAAEQFLRIRGHQVQVLKTFAVLDQMAFPGEGGGEIAANDLIILVNGHRMLRGHRLDNLWEWLEQGGALVASAHNPFIDADPEREDALLNRLPVTVVPFATEEDSADELAEDDTAEDLLTDDGGEAADSSEDATASGDSEGSDEATADETEAAAEAEPDIFEQWFEEMNRAAGGCERLQHLSPVEVADSAEPSFEVARLSGLGYQPAEHLEVRWATQMEPHHLLRFRQGSGDIALVSDANIWDNHTIGCADHAYALASLAEGRRKVWILVNMDAPSLWRLLWQAAPFAVLMLALALGLWLWNRGQRSEPRVPAETIERRSFLEHVRASATFLWRHKQGHELVEQLRRDLLQAANRRYPGFAAKGPQQQVEFLSHALELPLGEIRTALLAPPPTRAAEFTLVVNRLQYIRNNL